MKLYIISLAVGMLAGILYGVLNVRSPAPPVAALIGLLGMLIGEQLIPYGKQLVTNQSFDAQQMTAHTMKSNIASETTAQDESQQEAR